MAGVKGRSGRPANERLWRQVLTESAGKITPQGKSQIEMAAAVLWDKALSGDVSALKEIGDRLDGKAHQTSEAVVENRHHYVIETPAPAATVDEWQQKHGANKLIQ